MPERIQLRRTKGWRLPSTAKSVARPHRWGNPFVIGKVTFVTGPRAGQKATAADVVQMFRNRLETSSKLQKLARAELSGLDLACWCKPGDPCHADVLLEIANAAEPEPP